MVQRGKSFLETRKNLMKAAREAKLPGSTDTEEVSTDENNPIQQNTEDGRKKKVGNFINEAGGDLINSKAGQGLINASNKLQDIVSGNISEESKEKIGNTAEKIVNSKVGQKLINFANKVPDSKLGKLVDEATNTEDAEQVKETAQAAVEGVQGTQEERDALLGEDAELKKEYRFLRGAASIAKNTPIIKRLRSSKKFVQAWEDFEKSTYLSDGTIIIKEPTLEKVDGLKNTKNLAASILNAYLTKGKVVDAKTIKEKMDGFDDVSDAVLNKFIGGVIYAHIHNQPIDRDYVSNKYGELTKSEGFLTDKQAIVDLFSDDNTWAYGTDETMMNYLESDPELMKVIEAYQRIGAYADFLENNGYNQYGSTARGLAESYKDEGFESEGGMSLKEAYEIASKYDSKKLQNFIKQLSYNLQKTEKYQQRRRDSAEEYEGRWNARKQIMDVFKGTNALLSDFAEYNVEGRSESGIAKYSPLGLADLRVSGNTFTDEDGNIRNRNGKAIYMRQSDGSYVNQKGENVTKMLREHKGLLKNIGQHLEGIGTGIGQTMEGAALAQATADKEGTRAGMEYELEVVAGLTQTAFDSVLLANPHFLMLESTPVVGKGIELTFGALSELGASITLGALQIANLENNMDPVNVEAAKQIGGLISTMAVMRKFEKTVGPYKKAFIEAKNKAFSRYRDRIVEIMGKEELNDKIKKKALEDKSKEPTIIDGEKTIDELRGELGKERVEGKKGTEGKTENAEVKQEVVKQEAPSEEKVTINKPTEENTIDMTSTKDKLGYAFQVNKAVMSQMIKEFREEYKKNLDKYLPKDSTARAIFDIGEKSTDITIKESAQRALGDIGLSFKEMAKNIADGLKNIRGKAKTLPKKVSDKVTKTRQKDAYEKMELSTEERDTIQNNSKIGKLGRILQRLVSTKRGKVIKNMNINTPGEVKTLVKDTVVKDRIKEQLEAGVKRLQEWKKEIHEKFYQAMSQIKNIDFKDFFLGEDGIKKSLKELIRDSDAGTYVKFREEDGKIVVEFKKGYSQYYYEHVKPTIEKIVKEYNDIVENGKISEQNISNIADLMKDLRDEGEAMYKEGIRTQNAQKIKEGTAIMNAGKNMLGSLKSYLEQKGVAENFLLGEKVTAAKGDIDAEVKDFMTDGKIDEAKVKSFFEDLSKKKLAGEDIANDPHVKALEALKINVQEYADLYRNGSTALEKIYKTQLSLKEFESEFGKFFKKTGQVKRSGLGKFGTLIGGVLFRNTIGKILAGIGALGILTSPIDKVLEKLSNSVYQKNLRNALNDALKDPKNAKQIENILEGLNDTVKEIDRRLNAVIDKMAKKGEETVDPEQPKALPNKPNRKEYDTSHPNREEYDEGNAEPKDVTSETQAEWMPGDADMVIGEKEALPGAEKHELPDRRLALREDPEGDLQESMNDLEVQVTDALRQLMEMINDSKKGGDEPTTPTGPEGPDGGDNGGDNGGGGDTIDDFLKLIEGDAPEQGEGRPDFKNRSNESLNKLIDKDGNIKKGVPEEFHQEILNELSRREIKKQTDDSEVRTQNNIIRAILKQLDQIAEGKAEDNIREKYNEQVMQAWNVDTNRADEIIGDIVDGRLTEQDVYQDKTTYEDNQEASSWIEKWTEKTTKTTKSASKTSSLEVRDTKPDSKGKLNALKSQLATKKKAKPTKKRQEEIDKLEKEITRLEEKLNAKPLDNFDVADKEAVDNMIAEEEKPQVQPSEEKKSEPNKNETEGIEGDISTDIEDKYAEMDLRELLNEDTFIDPLTKEYEIRSLEITNRKLELIDNPKQIYREMKELLKDEDVTKEEAEFYSEAVDGARIKTDMSENNENRLMETRNELWKKTHDGLLFSTEQPKVYKKVDIFENNANLLEQAKEIAKEKGTPINVELNKLIIQDAMKDPALYMQVRRNVHSTETYARIANMFNFFNELNPEKQAEFLETYEKNIKKYGYRASYESYNNMLEMLHALEDTITELGESYGGEYEKYAEYISKKGIKKAFRESDYNYTDGGRAKYNTEGLRNTDLLDPTTQKTMEKFAMDVRDLSYSLDIDIAKILDKGTEKLQKAVVTIGDMKEASQGTFILAQQRGRVGNDAAGYYDPDTGDIAIGGDRYTIIHEIAHQITDIHSKIQKKGLKNKYKQIFGDKGLDEKIKELGLLDNMNDGRQSKEDYYKSTTEVVSRMIEMYLADKDGGKEKVETKYKTSPGYWDIKTYESKIKPLVEKMLKQLRKEYGSNKDRTVEATYEELIKEGYYDENI